MSAPVDVVAAAGGLSLPDAAAAYASAGLAVFPCVPGEKRPLTRHGLSDATADLNRVLAWWGRWPEANIGLVTGLPGGFDVLDIDVHPGGSGFPALRRARQAGLVDGWAVLVRSPSGGVHLYFPVGPEREQRPWALPRQHVDFRGGGRLRHCSTLADHRRARWSARVSADRHAPRHIACGGWGAASPVGPAASPPAPAPAAGGWFGRWV